MPIIFFFLSYFKDELYIGVFYHFRKVIYRKLQTFFGAHTSQYNLTISPNKC